MDLSNNSSNFLLQSGGGLQSQASPNQGSNTSGLQNNGNPLFSGSSGTGRQDILGQSTVVGPVQFDTSQLQNSAQDKPAQANSSVWVDGLVFVLLVFVVFFFILGARRIFRS